MSYFSNAKVGVRLGWGFGFMVMLILVSSLFTWKAVVDAEINYREFRHNTRGAVLLSEAQSALWELRYGFPQFMVGDAAGRAKVTGDESRLKAVVDEALKKYAQDQISTQERAKLQELVAIYEKYMAARPKWFELYGAGKLDEAKDWRAETTTPFGAGTVKAFKELIEMQQKVGEQTEAQAAAEVKSAKLLTSLLIAVAVLAGGALAFVVTRSITRPLNEALDVAQRVAAGDLTGTVEVNGKDETGVLLQALKDMNQNLRKIVGEVRSGTDSISTASQQIASGNADLSSRTEQQASSLEETASSMEELTSTVMQNAENAKQASQLAASASDVALKGGTVVGRVVQTMSEINDSSKKITDIISVIDGIAFQTNILALNAAVEAARAGEQGRGFAVVAAEVRTLAQRSAAAAKEIKQLIGDSVHKVEDGTRLVDEAGKTMEQIVASVKRVTDIMGEIAAASQEQSSGIEEVNQAIAQMDQVTQQNAALVEEASAAAESLKEQAQQLVQAAAVFKLAEGAQRPVEAARDARAEASRPQAMAVPAPVNNAPGAQNASRERRLRVAKAPRRAFAAQGGALAERPANDEWTEI